VLGPHIEKHPAQWCSQVFGLEGISIVRDSRGARAEGRAATGNRFKRFRVVTINHDLLSSLAEKKATKIKPGISLHAW
jgi:hypothetical protein